MTGRLMGALVLTAGFTTAGSAACLTVSGDRILAGELASVIPGMATIPAQVSIGPSPLPGVRRVFRRRDLSAIAKQTGVSIEGVPDFCIERVMETLDRERVVEAMLASIGVPDVRIEVVETSRYPVPRGRLEFRREGLHAPPQDRPGAPVDWRGSVLYGENHRFAVWARVSISAKLNRIVAAENLRRGERIMPSQLRLQTVEGFPDPGDLDQRIENIAGRISSRDVGAGEVVRVGQTTAATDVLRGESVEVEVQRGAARLLLTGRAETGGRAGEMVAVRNLSSNRLFKARVVGRGKVRVDSPAEGNA